MSLNHPHRINRKRFFVITMLAMATVLISGCSSDMSDLEQWVAEKKAERVPFRDDLPEIKPYESFRYTAHAQRSPFRPTVEQRKIQSNSGLMPRFDRNREILESFSLDTLRMVGSLRRGSTDSALVQTPDGLIHQVKPGNYMGENYGRITNISESSIELIEIVPDGLGGYVERDAAVGLSD